MSQFQPLLESGKTARSTTRKKNLKNPSVGDFPVPKNIEVSDPLSPVPTDAYSDAESVQIISDSSEDDVKLLRSFTMKISCVAYCHHIYTNISLI